MYANYLKALHLCGDLCTFSLWKYANHLKALSDWVYRDWPIFFFLLLLILPISLLRNHDHKYDHYATSKASK